MYKIYKSILFVTLILASYLILSSSFYFDTREVNAISPTETPLIIPGADKQSLTILITPCPLKSQGDANCDDRITLNDFEIWRREFTGYVSSKNADFTGDNRVTLADFEAWRRAFTTGVTIPTLTSTPTPTSSPQYTPTPSPTLGVNPSPTLAASPSPSPTLPQQAKPNIIFILTDDQPAESVTAMPYLKNRTDWFTFTQATVNVAYCCPSRATILTGQYAHHTGVIDNSKGALMNENQTIALALQAGGYRTGLIGKYLNGYPFGRSLYIPAGWNHWEAFTPVNPAGQYNYTMYENGNMVSYGSAPADYTTDVIAQKSIKFLETTQEPFFLYVATYAPHAPFTPAPRHVNAYANLTMPRYPNFNEADVSDKPAWVRNLGLADPTSEDNQRRRQYEMLLSIDEMIEKIVAKLAAKGTLDRTVIFYMTDNGYSHGEHRWTEKRCEYEECIRTPLKIRYPFAAPRVIDAPVANIDIAPTLAGLAQVVFTTSDGLSLLPLLRNQTISWRTGTLHYWRGSYGGSTPEGFWAIRRKDWKYVELLTGEKELYNLVNDPYELVNLAGQSGTSSIQAQLASELLQLKQ